MFYWDWIKAPVLKIGLYSNPSPSQSTPQWKQLGVELRVVPKSWLRRCARWLSPNPIYGCWGEYEITSMSEGTRSPKLELLWNPETAEFNGEVSAQPTRRYQLNVYHGMNSKLARAVVASKEENQVGLRLHSERVEPASGQELNVVVTVHYAESEHVTKQATIRNPDDHCASFVWTE